MVQTAAGGSVCWVSDWLGMEGRWWYLTVPPCLTVLSHSLYKARLGFVPLAEKEVEQHVQVHVRDNNVDQALRALKKKMQREGIFREMKLRRSYEKPSERRARWDRLDRESTDSRPWRRDR